MKRVPIKWAQAIAERTGAEVVVVLTFGGGGFTATSYGATKAQCSSAGRWIDDLAGRLSSGELPAPDIAAPSAPAQAALL